MLTTSSSATLCASPTLCGTCLALATQTSPVIESILQCPVDLIANILPLMPAPFHGVKGVLRGFRLEMFPFRRERDFYGLAGGRSHARKDALLSPLHPSCGTALPPFRCVNIDADSPPPPSPPCDGSSISLAISPSQLLSLSLSLSRAVRAALSLHVALSPALP